MNPTLSILLPMHNPGMNLNMLLRILRAFVEVPHEVLLVVDHTDTHTPQLVATLQTEFDARLQVIPSEAPTNLVQSLALGHQHAHGDYILIFAADEVGPILAINDMLWLAQQGCQLVSCTRYAHGGRRLGGSWFVGWLSRMVNAGLHRFGGFALTDTTTGIKLFPRDLLDNITLESHPVGWVAAFELSLKAQLAGYKLGEVPLISIDRLYGGLSNFSFWAWSREYLRWALWGVLQLRKPTTKRYPPAMVRIPTQETLIGSKA